MTHKPLGACILILLTYLSVSAQSQQTPQVAGKSTFSELAEKAKKGDRSVDFTELRIAFYESANYNPHTPMMTYRPLYGGASSEELCRSRQDSRVSAGEELRRG